MKKKIAVVFGGISPEHEVSVITGLQVMEHIDLEKYEPYAIYLSKEGLFRYYKGMKRRRDFKLNSGEIVNFGVDKSGGFFKGRALGPKINIDAVYMAFHGGNGEGGQAQGFFETLSLPYTSPSVEASVSSMNKAITKEVLASHNLPVIPGISLFSVDVKKSLETQVEKVVKEFGLPVIIKPAHLGSSIGINIAKTAVELKKFLLEVVQMDSEIIVERLLKDFVEYNCAVRLIDGNVECSEIERPINKDEILSFADKYERGGKKQSGMASLNRQLPAKISESLKKQIQETARKAFIILRCKGMVRIDFMSEGGKLYITEVNPIPGSMAFYLWEAAGINFTQQITDLIEQSIKDFRYSKSLELDYKSDIVEKFIKS
jgi:D-alanine-D-alanine ligase